MAHFQQMLKQPDSVKEVEARAVNELRALLEQVPAIKIKAVQSQAAVRGGEVDIVTTLTVAGRRHLLICEVKVNGQPRNVRVAVLQLRNYIAHLGKAVTPLLIAPYLSPDARALCRKEGVGFLDFEGNARLVFGGVFVERSVPNKPSAERRELRSLFKPKSAQVLTVMLGNPNHAWRVTELAAAAGVSLGHVSNVRAGLLDREWGTVSDKGLSLSAPDELLNAWRDAYQPPPGQCMSFYTTLHGSAFENAARRVLHVGSDKGQAAFASFSAAHWLAPYGRSGTEYFYADESGLRHLTAALKLSSAAKGENVVVTVPKESGLFRATVEPATGAVCTGLVQTYLDLSAAGERGREAAEHLRRERLTWRK
jgi:hypothetical protein